ncbi:MAG: GNAT family N-acetyltransferase [Pyrinomonadaceae bacterium]
MSVEIVEFRDEFADAFASLNYRWIEAYFSVEKHDREILDDPRKFVIEPGGQILMAVSDGKGVGTVALIPSGEGVLELTKMAVDPEHQGKGLSNLLMAAAITYARKIGTRVIFLESHRSLKPALGLYRKFGFVETPIDLNSEYARADIRMELAIELPVL